MSVSKCVTFLTENCLYTAVLWASVRAVVFYVAVVKLPALAVMLVDSFVATLSVHTIVIFVVLSNSRAPATGEFLSNHVAELSRGHAVVCLTTWTGMFLCTTSISSPFIAAIPGGTTASSLISVGAVLGFGAVVPFLSIMSAFIATPAGSYTSIVNGTSISAMCLVFFVLLSLGSSGTTKCNLAGSANSFAFYMLVFLYLAAIALVEMVVFYKRNIQTVTGVEVHPMAASAGATLYSRLSTMFKNFFVLFPVTNVWRLVSGAVNFVIVWSTLGFCSADVTWAVQLALLFVVALHIPMVITPDMEVVKRWYAPAGAANGPAGNRPRPATTFVPGRQMHNDPNATAPHASTPSLACFPRPFPKGAVFDSAGKINSRVFATLPRHRRGVEDGLIGDGLGY
jgi:hypothetical protein